MWTDIEALFDDNDINYDTEGKNVSPGWYNVQCPFCDDHSNHGGFNPHGNYYNCWRCGVKGLEKALSVVMSITRIEAGFLIAKYRRYDSDSFREGGEEKYENENLVLPGRLKPLNKQAKKYLHRRGLNPGFLEKKYDLQITDHISSYRFRIFIPVYYEQRVVSYICRDYTDKQELRYKACKKENELIDHKTLLYNLDNCWRRKAIIVEGVTDVWNFGNSFCAIFGTGYRTEQVSLIAEKFDSVGILFDPEPDAQIRAIALAEELDCIGVEPYLITGIHPTKDPGQYNKKEKEEVHRQFSICT